MYLIGEEEIEEIARVIRSGQLFRVGDPEAGHLQECERFEQEWAEKTGTKYALLMSGGGTAALVCALAGLGIGPGDEVIVPAYTWLATATAVLTVGAIPVLAEIDETLTLDPEDVERKVGPDTRAVIPVHMIGRCANMDRILEVAREHDLKVVEDCCQMVGGSYKGKRVGSWGDVGAFSFNAMKIIGCGEGGALVTSDRTVYETAFTYHDSGCAFRPKAAEITIPIFTAQQYRASEIMGAIMRVQARRLDSILSDLRSARKMIERELQGVPGLMIAPNNDSEGDCGVAVALQFESESHARSFAADTGIGGHMGIDSDKHVYTNWKPLRDKRIMHRREMNPFYMDANRRLRADYSDGACPRTLDILRRTFFMVVDPAWDESDVSALVERCTRALSSRRTVLGAEV